MLVYHTTEDQIMTAADRTGVQVTEMRENSVGIQFKLRSIRQPDGFRRYGKRNPFTGQRGCGVCYHGWVVFLTTLWEVNPSARVKTTRGTFNSYEHFKRNLKDLDGELELYGKRCKESKACTCVLG